MPKKNDTQKLQFDGIATPNTTQCPDVYFDQVFPQLKEAELKALLYIVRRTFGFKKNRDPISFNQFLRGITTRDGRVLDLGCGIRDRTTLSRALKALETMGVLVSDKGVDERGENVTTIYSLRFKETIERVVGISYHPGMNHPLPVVGNSYPQQTVEQQTVNSIRFESIANLQKPSNSKFSKERDAKSQKPRASQDRESTARASDKSAFTAVGQVLATRKVSPPVKDTPSRPKTGPGTAPGAEDASYVIPAESAPSRPARGRPPKATEQIEAVLEQISAEFHDDEHLQSNIGQAARIWKDSGLNEAAFVGRLYEARSITKQRGDIQKRASGDAGEWGARNRMPYFFVVVRDLLGLKESRGHAEG